MSELKAAIKNGIERGENLQEIGQSLINAGYSKIEIDEAISEVNGVMKVLPRPVQQNIDVGLQAPSAFTNIPMDIPNLENMSAQPTKQGFFNNKRNILIIILASILILLGSLIGLVVNY